MSLDFLPAAPVRRLAGLSAAVATALALMAPTGAQAVISTTGCANASSCTLAELFAGGTIEVNGLLFDNWADDLQDASGTGDIPDVSLITVTGDDSTALAPSLLFESWSQEFIDGQDVDHFGDIYSAFFFDATLQDGTSRIAGTNIAIERFIRGATDYDMYVQSGADQLVGSLEAFVSTVFGTQLSDGEALGASVNALTNVAPAVTLTNIDSSSPGVLLLDLRQTFELDRLPPVPAPEPGTLAILAAGLAGLGLARRRKAA